MRVVTIRKTSFGLLADVHLGTEKHPSEIAKCRKGPGGDRVPLRQLRRSVWAAERPRCPLSQSTGVSSWILQTVSRLYVKIRSSALARANESWHAFSAGFGGSMLLARRHRLGRRKPPDAVREGAVNSIFVRVHNLRRQRHRRPKAQRKPGARLSVPGCWRCSRRPTGSPGTATDTATSSPVRSCRAASARQPTQRRRRIPSQRTIRPPRPIIAKST